jgi:hypothetical protein
MKVDDDRAALPQVDALSGTVSVFSLLEGNNP